MPIISKNQRQGRPWSPPGMFTHCTGSNSHTTTLNCTEITIICQLTTKGKNDDDHHHHHLFAIIKYVI